jgi:hypothetical protein
MSLQSMITNLLTNEPRTLVSLIDSLGCDPVSFLHAVRSMPEVSMVLHNGSPTYFIYF